MMKTIALSAIIILLLCAAPSTLRADAGVQLWFNPLGYHYSPGLDGVLRFGSHPRRHYGQRYWPRRHYGHFHGKPRHFKRHGRSKHYRDHGRRHRHGHQFRHHDQRRHFGHRHHRYEKRRYGYCGDHRGHSRRHGRGRIRIR